MTGSARSSVRMVWTAVRVTVVFTLVLGVAYPLAVTGVGQIAFPRQANGSIIDAADGQPAGSALIGQAFTDAAGDPLPQYFQSRPSAADYDASSSGGSNLGPQNPELVAEIATRRAQIAAFNGVPASAVPADAVTASGSGLDPHISPAYAAIQVQRVAKARGLSTSAVAVLVAAHTRGRDLGYLGEPRVNVLELNLALDDGEG